MDANIISRNWRKTIKNPHFVENCRLVRRESCLITSNPHNHIFIVNTESKRFLYFVDEVVDENGEIDYTPFSKNSNDIAFSKMRFRILERAALLDNIIESVITLFITLTMPEMNEPITEFLRKYKQKLSRKGYIIVNHIFVLEFGEKNENPHYHIALSFEKCKYEMSDFFPDTQMNWKGRTEVSKVKKSAFRYMCKYLTKNKARCFNHRNFGLSNSVCAIKKAP